MPEHDPLSTHRRGFLKAGAAGSVAALAATQATGGWGRMPQSSALVGLWGILPQPPVAIGVSTPIGGVDIVSGVGGAGYTGGSINVSPPGFSMGGGFHMGDSHSLVWQAW